MDKAANDRMVKLFDITYHVAKHERPFTYFPDLVKLQQRHGVDIGHTYHNATQAKVFTEHIAEDIRRKLLTEISGSRYISILIDGSTDRSQTEKELMYIKYLRPEDGIPQMRFFG